MSGEAVPAAVAKSFSIDDFLARAAARLSLVEPAPDAPLQGDHRLGEGEPSVALRPAAVLLPVVRRGSSAHMLLTRRADGLRQHSGQIAFPGGKLDGSDTSPIDAALREAEEEIGLPRSQVTPVGYLDTYATRTGFRIFPIVAVVRPPLDLRLNPMEVEEAFEIPLAFLMEASNHQRHVREWQGSTRHFYAMPYGERNIWGVTAGILRNLYERLYG